MLASGVNPYRPRERRERGELSLLQRVGEDADRGARDGIAAGVDDDDVERDGHRAHAHGDAFEQDGVERRVAREEQRHGEEGAGQVDARVVGDEHGEGREDAGERADGADEEVCVVPALRRAIRDPAAAEGPRRARQKRDHAQGDGGARLVHPLVAHKHDRGPSGEGPERRRERRVGGGRDEPVARAQDEPDRPQRRLLRAAGIEGARGFGGRVGCLFERAVGGNFGRAARGLAQTPHERGGQQARHADEHEGDAPAEEVRQHAADDVAEGEAHRDGRLEDSEGGGALVRREVVGDEARRDRRVGRLADADARADGAERERHARNHECEVD